MGRTNIFVSFSVLNLNQDSGFGITFFSDFKKTLISLCVNSSHICIVSDLWEWRFWTRIISLTGVKEPGFVYFLRVLCVTLLFDMIFLWQFHTKLISVHFTFISRETRYASNLKLVEDERHFKSDFFIEQCMYWFSNFSCRFLNPNILFPIRIIVVLIY